MFFSVSSAEDKQLSVYAPQGSYTLKIVSREKTDYVDLSELIQPLAPFDIKAENQGARVKVNRVEGHFTNGSDKVKIGKDYLQVAAAIVIAGDQQKLSLLLPVGSIVEVLSRFLKVRLDFHVTARRLFIEHTASLFSAQIRKSEDPALLLSFPARVDPRISVDGSKMRLVFTRDPVVGGADKVAFDDNLIASLTYSEANGSAEVTVNGKSPLLASFADQGKTIVISAAPAPAPVAQAPAAPVAITNSAGNDAAPVATGTVESAKPSGPTPLAAALAAAMPHYFVMVDAGHGGAESGARFSDRLLEKDVTLSLARRLKTELQSRGLNVVLLRDGDTGMSLEQRALAANTQRASVYVSIHAAVGESGVHVYTAFLPQSDNQSQRHNSLFLPWETAHAPYLDRSRILANGLVAELGSKQIKAVTMSAPVPPLNNVAATAIVIDVGASSDDADSLTSPAYQQAVAHAAAAAISNTRSKLEGIPLR